MSTIRKGDPIIPNTPASLAQPPKGSWYYYGNAAPFQDIENRLRLLDLSPSDNKILSSFAYNAVLLTPLHGVAGRGLVKDNAQKFDISKIAIFLYGSPLTYEKFQQVDVKWVSGSDLWDSVRGSINSIADFNRNIYSAVSKPIAQVSNGVIKQLVPGGSVISKILTPNVIASSAGLLNPFTLVNGDAYKKLGDGLTAMSTPHTTEQTGTQMQNNLMPNNLDQTVQQQPQQPADSNSLKKIILWSLAGLSLVGLVCLGIERLNREE